MFWCLAFCACLCQKTRWENAAEAAGHQSVQNVHSQFVAKTTGNELFYTSKTPFVKPCWKTTSFVKTWFFRITFFKNLEIQILFDIWNWTLLTFCQVAKNDHFSDHYKRSFHWVWAKPSGGNSSGSFWTNKCCISVFRISNFLNFEFQIFRFTFSYARPFQTLLCRVEFRNFSCTPFQYSKWLVLGS